MLTAYISIGHEKRFEEKMNLLPMMENKCSLNAKFRSSSLGNLKRAEVASKQLFSESNQTDSLLRHQIKLIVIILFEKKSFKHAHRKLCILSI